MIFRPRGMLLTAALVAVAPVARANPFGYHQHDGFYLRLAGGVASLNVERTTSEAGATGSLAYSSDGSSIRGASIFTEVSAGGTLLGHVVVAATLLGDGLPSAELKLASGSRLDLGSTLAFAMLGPTVDVFPSSGGGFHFGGGVGLATSTAGIKDPIFDTIGGLGVGITGALGYDLWIADDWSVGALARGVAARVGGSQQTNQTVGSERDVITSFALAATFLYH
jgi:hypothetical protein